ncbi:hypothetical protein HYO35_22155 [Vibrio parahaemolyticus]|nr:hypothetical protein [Vibrio parahaemolyticus]
MITAVALIFVWLAVKESSLPMIESFSNSKLYWLFQAKETSGLVFNISCGAIAAYIFWFIDIFIPRHQEFSIARKYIPQWKRYLSQHKQQLDYVLQMLGETKDGQMTRCVSGNISGIYDSLDIGVQFPKVPSAKVVYSLNAINTVVTDIRKYEHALNRTELKLIHELHMELTMYLSFISTKSEIGSNKDFSDIKLIRSKLNSFLNTKLFKSVS